MLLNNVWHAQFKQCVCHTFNACGMTSAVNSAGTNMETIIYSALVVYLMSKSNLMTSRLNVNTKNFMIIKVRPNNLNVFVKCRFTRYSTIELYIPDALANFYFFMVYNKTLFSQNKAFLLLLSDRDERNKVYSKWINQNIFCLLWENNFNGIQKQLLADVLQNECP